MNTALSTLTGKAVTDPKSVIDRGWSCSRTNTTGCRIKTDKVHSICQGVVLSVLQDPKDSAWCVTVEVNSSIWVRYCRLSSVVVKEGQNITSGTLIGDAYKKLMRLEYCTSTESRFPVRVRNKQLYKHDPTPIIFSIKNLSEVI